MNDKVMPGPKASTNMSSALPFGQLPPLSSISGPTYVTGQLLVQQVAYKLSDKLFSYSPETFHLHVAAKAWSLDALKNIHNEPTSVVPLQTRTGAGALALGYIFSPDFDLRKRHIPQSLLAPSLSLPHLRQALDHLSLLYGVSSPFVAHIAAVDYSAGDGLVANYDTALRLAEDLGLGLLVSASAYEAQHMALFATLMAAILPTVHIYDGVRASRETLRVVDALGEAGLKKIYEAIAGQIPALNKRLGDADAGKVVELLHALNDELGTSYAPFEYHGHERAATVLVVLGSVEAQIARQAVAELAAGGERFGVVVVRVYRPFVEEAFLEVLPETVSRILVLGQVQDAQAEEDAGVHSALFADVLAATAFTDKWLSDPLIVDAKYAAATTHTPASVAAVILGLSGKLRETTPTLPRLSAYSGEQQFTFWDVDDSAASNLPAAVASRLSKESTSNIYVHEVHDNLIQGGAVRTDIRDSKKAIETPYAVEAADVIYIGEEKLLQELPILDGVRPGGKVVLRLPTFRNDDLEKRLPAAVRKALEKNSLQLFILDSTCSPATEKDVQLLSELAFLHIAQPNMATEQLLQKFSGTAQEQSIKQCIFPVEVPATWAEAADSSCTPPLTRTFQHNSFTSFSRAEPESDVTIGEWKSAAKGLAFKEAHAAQTNALRPDLPTKTYTIRVKEKRRLTPTTYDRNVFHIEFDLGDSGLTYKIGEALGIHADNNPEQVLAFINSYGGGGLLDADALVQVPSREDPADVLETRTVFQALVQNMDIMGKPPKRFFESLAEFAKNSAEREALVRLAGKDGAEELKRLNETDTVTYVDVLETFTSARPGFQDLARIVAPLKRREYSIASAQAVTPGSVALMIVVVEWVDSKDRRRLGQATRYLSGLQPGDEVVVSVKPSVMKLPAQDSAPLIMAGLGTGLAPFRAFVQYRAKQKAEGKRIGSILLYLGSRHRREEYLYGEEWEAYLDAGVVTLLGAAFSRDQPRKVYIQDRMRQTMADIVRAYIEEEGSFYLCGPTWPVPDVTKVLEEAIGAEAHARGAKVNARNEIERLKESGRYVLEVY